MKRITAPFTATVTLTGTYTYDVEDDITTDDLDAINDTVCDSINDNLHSIDFVGDLDYQDATYDFTFTTDCSVYSDTIKIEQLQEAKAG